MGIGFEPSLCVAEPTFVTTVLCHVPAAWSHWPEVRDGLLIHKSQSHTGL